jgi:sporulation protein YlmC with PRC-barrel domain
MPTRTGHTTAILASKVKGTAVFDRDGSKIGHVEDVMLDKSSNEILYAVVAFGGFLGIGEKYHPVPWPLLDYEPRTGGYVVPLDRSVLERAPVHELNELTRDDGTVGAAMRSFYEKL